MREIVSESNPLYKLFVKLLSAKKYRKQERSYLAEGLNALDTPKERVKAYLLPLSAKENLRRWDIQPEKVILLADPLFKKLSADPASQGLIVWIQAQEHTFQPSRWQHWQPELYLALEDIQDPGNLGTMIRTAEAAGVKAIICSSGTVDIYHPKVIKAAASSLGRVQVLTDADLTELIASARKSKLPVFAATPMEAQAYDKEDYRKGALLLIGNEGKGLSDGILAAADKRVYIPMAGQIESLNAAISAAILLFEAKRQRSEI